MTDSRIRRIARADVPAAVALVHELAAYEREPESCRLTEEQLSRALFGPDPKLFGHVATDADGAVAGVALWFLNFSTWRGEHGLYLEDLFVRPDQRGGGLGRALLTALAEECLAQGYERLEWVVLDWNEPAIGFYRSLGAVAMDDWTVNRLTGEALQALGAAAATAGRG
ncbi:GNAT family N-acetyltransferase [Nocardioides terrae]|uniref:GNAT family N-acetyltransferase n=1 Tax=Nocardioides terrae TaxID=574651 RepID=UPI000B86FE19|nr:GNAT family N-acetyltransferase [Nocardioides terrae]